jgi:myo-inositol 2-dehydrogenase/D-chiro-inositol 1-dehydrogenase
MNHVKVGIVGLGRIGKIHAENLVYRIPGAKLTAACSIVESELDYAQNEWGVTDGYLDFNEMLQKADIDAVTIVTSSSQHCQQVEAAFKAGKHVFVEKPLGITMEECKRAEKAVESRPDKIFMIGFMRRYDPSYVYAKRKIDAGEIGVPYLVKATGIDPLSGIEGFLKIVHTTPGLFIGMGVHDIDLMKWFLGSNATTVYAIGGNYLYPKFGEYGDVEVGCAIYQFENGTMGMLHTGRTAVHGYHIETEVIGTKGSIRISPVPRKNLAMLYNKDGVLVECVEEFRERFAEAFRLELQEFVDCIRQGRKPEVTVYDATQSTQIMVATTEALKQKKLVNISY